MKRKKVYTLLFIKVGSNGTQEPTVVFHEDFKFLVELAVSRISESGRKGVEIRVTNTIGNEDMFFERFDGHHEFAIITESDTWLMNKELGL